MLSSKASHIEPVGPDIWTIGHSTHPIEKFLELLKSNGVQELADVRLLPGSRRHPQFNQDQFAASLWKEGIAYQHFRELGGRRRPRKDSKNTAWRNDAFRGYADYMETDEFAAGIARLLSDGEKRRVCIMCAEAVWWQCHRGLISDYLKARGHHVWHILTTGKTQEHPFTSAASLVDGQLSYAAAKEPQLELSGVAPARDK